MTVKELIQTLSQVKSQDIEVKCCPIEGGIYGVVKIDIADDGIYFIERYNGESA